MDLSQRLIWLGWGLAHIATPGLVGWGSIGAVAEVAWFPRISPGVNSLVVIDATSSHRSREGRTTMRLISVVLVGIVGVAICMGLLFVGGIRQNGMLLAAEPTPQDQSSGQLLWWAALANLAAMFTTFLVLASSRSEGSRDRSES